MGIVLHQYSIGFITVVIYRMFGKIFSVNESDPYDLIEHFAEHLTE